MGYIENAFERMNMYQIINFLLYGVECDAKEAPTYQDALKKGCDPIFRRLDALYPNAAERDEAAADLSKALTVYEYVYMELGMKAGARLIQQLLLTDNQVCVDKINRQ